MPCEPELAVITGMRAEALLARGARVVCSGGRAEQAHRLAATLLAEGAGGLLSFGIAGGMRPGLRAGQLVVAGGVAVGGRMMACDQAWSMALRRCLPSAVDGVVLGAAAVAVTPREKHLWASGTGTIAVDLESAAVAQACGRAGRPFAVLRAVADPAERGIPEPALVGLDAAGRMRPMAVAWALAHQPGTLPALVRLALDTRAALRALAEAVRLIGPTLGFDGAIGKSTPPPTPPHQGEGRR